MSNSVATFDVALDVVVGEVIAIEPTESISPGFWLRGQPDTYAGGQDFFLNPSAGYNTFTADSVIRGTPVGDNFQTFVTVSPATAVPEPASFTLLGLGMAGIAAFRQHRAA